MPEPEKNPVASGAAWTFLTNHSHVLICLVRDPAARVRDIAILVGITERAVQRIVADLEEAGVITRQRAGRRNQYEIRSEHSLRFHQRRLTQLSERAIILCRVLWWSSWGRQTRRAASLKPTG